MKIAGFLKQTMKDYSPLLAAEIFTAGCNYKCPSCHSAHIVGRKQNFSEEEIFSYLKEAKGFLDGLVICGGEPTIQHDLPYFLKKIKKETNLSIKLDTNGSNPFVLEDLFEEKLVDYIALDIKGPPSLYRKLIGITRENNILKEPKKFDFRDNLEKAIGIVQNASDFELRTTLVPVYEGNNPRWMTPEEIGEMSNYVSGFIFTDPSKLKWYVQKFISRSKEDSAMLDDKFTKENLPSEYHETPVNVLEYARDILRKRFPRAEIR